MNQTIRSLLIACCVALLCSCNAARQLERKQQEALNTVKASRPLIDSVCKICMELYAPDSTAIIFLQGDSIPYPVPVKDTVAIKKAIDSLINFYNALRPVPVSITDYNCNKEIDAAYKKGYKDAEENISKQKLPPLIDAEKVKQLIATNNYLKQQNKDVAQQLASANSRVNFLESSEKQFGYTWHLAFIVTLKQWWFWLIVLLVAAFFVLRTRFSTIFSFFKQKQ